MVDRLEIELLAEDVAVGDRSAHLVCPVCGGGSSHEESFLIWRDADGIAYQCYRVKCGVRGKFFSRSRESAKVEIKRKPALTTDMLTTQPLPNRVVDWLLTRFNWLAREDLATHGVLWDYKREAVLLPIRFNGTHEGYIARVYPELQTRKHSFTSKAKAFYVEGITNPACIMQPTLGTPHVPSKLVLVEDYWSAARLVLAGIPAVALSGTSITDRCIIELSRAFVKEITLVLDSDATLKAGKLVKECSLLFSSINSIPLYGPDVKDMNEGEFKQLCAKLK